MLRYKQFFCLRVVYPLDTLLPMSGKDSGLRIRVERPLHEQFLQVCRSQDRPAAQVLREFMRDYVARNADEPEPKLEDKSAKLANK